MTSTYYRTLLRIARDLYERDADPDRAAAWRRARALARLLAAFLTVLALVGCMTSPPAPSARGWAAQAEPAPNDDAQAACLITPSCVSAVYCDALEDDTRCEGQASDSCLTFMVPAGTECFPNADVKIGRCDGRGSCE